MAKEKSQKHGAPVPESRGQNTALPHAHTADSETILTLSMSEMALSDATSKPPKAQNPKKPRRDIVDQFRRYFGNESEVANWVRLCRDVGIQEDLKSIRQCRLALKNVWVNIFDLIDAVDAEKTPPKLFKNERALSKYTMNTGKIYPKRKAKEGGPVRGLLAHIFCPK
ncbi:uncharacterized protein L3040_006391 [Drepanopeziza brunnea f. sp. 'multigermtubi']|uniref:uncharacterized protein n=1 Tax=Drepanopeziza brunnea f. sp. 'multigermtubi' TaxID=698441 RepID=UPI00239BBFD5|nr:hypothetical protein L3040_006391 [Drepanopeziza brunnea f. sp. 'multigermtubi']